MSQFIQHPAAAIKLSFAARRAAWLLSLVVLIAVIAMAVILLVSSGSGSSSSAQPATKSTVPGARYDGGPEEGTAGIVNDGPRRGFAPRVYHEDAGH